MVFCPKCIYATIYFQYLFFASWMFSTTLFLPPVTMQQRTFHNISKPNTTNVQKKGETYCVYERYKTPPAKNSPQHFGSYERETCMRNSVPHRVYSRKKVTDCTRRYKKNT